MTLVLACLTHQYVVQVSDRRVSKFVNGQLKLVDDHRNKATLYCSDIAFAYSGLGIIENQHTDLWIMNVLTEAMSLNDTAGLLRNKATETFKKLRYPRETKRHAFVGVGWGQPSESSPILPLQVTVSNALDKNGDWLANAKDEFEIKASILEENKSFIICHPTGAQVPQEQLEELRKNINRCIKHNVGPLEYVRLLGETIHRVANYEPSVGKNLIAVILPKNAAFKSKIFFFTPLHPGAVQEIDEPMFLHISDDIDNMIHYAPNFVCQGATGVFGSVDASSVNTHLIKAIKNAEAGFLRLAISDFTNVIEADPFNSNAYLNRGIAYTQLNKLKEAISDFNRVIELDPNNVDAYYNRGTVHGQSNNFKEAISDFDKAVNLEPNHSDSYINRGIVYGKSNNLKQAILDFECALKLAPNSVKVFHNRGFAYAQAGDHRQAILDFSEAIRLDPDNPNIHHLRGFSYAASGNLQSAISDFDQAIKLDANNARVYFDRGAAHTGLNNFKEALVDLNKAIELGLDDGKIYYRRGMTYAAVGNFGKAISDFEKYLELVPDAQNRKMVLNIIEELKSELNHKKQVE